MSAELLDRLRREAELAAVGADPAHDLGHVRRVVATACHLARVEGAKLQVVQIAALLHELVNLPKSHPDSARSGEFCAMAAARLMRREGVELTLSAEVAECIRVHAFSAGFAPTSLEAQVLQDADRLDAIGAIGIARCFATCASMGRPFYSLEDPFCETRSPDDKRFGIDHFYRKLLRIRDTLNTSTARQLAADRARFMDEFLSQLRRELAEA